MYSFFAGCGTTNSLPPLEPGVFPGELGIHKKTGRGEGSSRLTFDSIVPVALVKGEPG